MKQLAAHYLRYWYQTPDKIWTVSDNAPADFWKFIITLPSTTDRAVIHQALTFVATGTPVAAPDTADLLAWFAIHPLAVARCDEVLSAKIPPKNLSTVLRSAYLNEVQAARNIVQEFLKAELAKY